MTGIDVRPHDRFAGKVHIDPSGCWEWLGYRNRKGYGGVSHQGVYYLAHRLAWILAHGEIADGLVICHRCDNPPCVNPEHLFMGTVADNNHDMFAKQRGVALPVIVGEQHYLAVVSDEDVRHARKSYCAGAESAAEIAARLDVHLRTVDAWLAGRNRRSAGGPMRESPR